MRHTIVKFGWRDAGPAGRYSSGVCLHGHTMHSEECLSFLPRYLRQIPGVSHVVRGYERGPKPVDFARAYWTPPLSPVSALRLEEAQIAAMGLRPLVSLTDHDNIEAPMSLQVTEDPHQVPVSVEWTVPYERSILHLGVHNLPAASARQCISAMAAYAAAPAEEHLPDLFSEFAKIPSVLIVLNHPF